MFANGLVIGFQLDLLDNVIRIYVNGYLAEKPCFAVVTGGRKAISQHIFLNNFFLPAAGGKSQTTRRPVSQP
jgi:hypothetical protein